MSTATRTTTTRTRTRRPLRDDQTTKRPPGEQQQDGTTRLFPQGLAHPATCPECLFFNYRRDSATFLSMSKSISRKYWRLEEQHESAAPQMQAKFGSSRLMLRPCSLRKFRKYKGTSIDPMQEDPETYTLNKCLPPPESSHSDSTLCRRLFWNLKPIADLRFEMFTRFTLSVLQGWGF